MEQQQLTRYQRYYQSLPPEKKAAALERKAEYRKAHREELNAYRRAYREARRHGEEPPKEGRRKYVRKNPVRLDDLDDEGDDG